MSLFDWLHTFTPSRIAFTFFGIPVYWYGLGYALALALTFWLGKKLTGPERVKAWEEVWWWTAIFGLVGARLYFILLLEPVYFWHRPAEILAIWKGGMAIHGGILGGILGICYANSKLPTANRQPPTLYWFDLVSPLLALGQAIGRFGNYFNQELYGRPTALPWGIPISGQAGYFHPTFLYESILDALLALFLWRTFKKNQQRGKPAGRVLALYLIGYGLIRFLMEFLRLDETTMLGFLRLPQVVATVMVVMGIIVLKTRATLKCHLGA